MSPPAADSTAPRIPQEIAEAAMEWWVELQSEPVTADMQAACLLWRQAQPEHEQAWQIILGAHGRLRASGLPSALAHATLTAPRRRPQRRKAIKTLVALAFVGSAALTARHQGIVTPWLADYRSGVGQRRDILLADGSQVALDTGTALDVRFDEHARCLRLLVGQIHIATAPDSARPFFVDTAQGRAQALGTRFTVRQDEGYSRVAVFEGAVALTPRLGGQRRVLAAGEQAGFDLQAIGPSSTASDSAAAWRQGMLIALDMRLDDFLAELGRYRSGWVICDPQVAALRVSGSFPLADTDRALEALANTLPVEIAWRTRYWVAVRPPQGAG